MDNTTGPIRNVPDIRLVHGYKKSEVLNRQGDYCGGMGKSFATAPTGMPEDNPLKAKGKKIMSSMKKQYGAKKGKQVFYASKNKGIIEGVD